MLWNYIAIIRRRTTAATVLSIPLALLAGAFTVVAPEAYKKMMQ
ncbi:MAG TPA: hypothetical protein VI278_10235 [Nitrososphaeraceae archaeon]